jgi:hypothetical protein
VLGEEVAEVTVKLDFRGSSTGAMPWHRIDRFEQQLLQAGVCRAVGFSTRFHHFLSRAKGHLDLDLAEYSVDVHDRSRSRSKILIL